MHACMATVSASTLMDLPVTRFCYAHVMCPSASTTVTIAISRAKMLRERHVWQTRLRGMLRERHGQACGPTTWHAEGKAWPDLWANYVRGMLRERHGQACGPTTWHAEGKAWPAVRSSSAKMLRARHGNHGYVTC